MVLWINVTEKNMSIVLKDKQSGSDWNLLCAVILWSYATADMRIDTKINEIGKN